MTREARYSVKEADGTVQCRLCAHECRIPPGRAGLCRVRENRDGVLHTLNWGLLAAEAADPVEKKPLYHFLPGSRTWSLATMGCNFRCRHCQNHQLSQLASPDSLRGLPRKPEEVIRMAQAADCASLSYTYSEPTVFFEFAEDCGQAARAAGLRNILVSNGFMAAEAAQRAAGWLDAANIDIKAFSDRFYREVCGARLIPVLDTVQRLWALGVWVEATTLLIPGLNDSEQELQGLARFLVGISPDLPWHLSAFHPAYRLLDAPPTPPETLVRAREIGWAAGLRFVYLGNVRLADAGDTLCPGCGRLLIRRLGFGASGPGIAGQCPDCGAVLPGRWR